MLAAIKKWRIIIFCKPATFFFVNISIESEKHAQKKFAMSKKSNYISTNRSKHYLKCHLIFVCNYRKKLLVGQLKDDMRSILLQINANSDFESEVFESDLDHIHFLIRYVPPLSITSIVRKLKQASTYHIWHSSHKSFLSKHFWKEHTFCSDRYFVCSIVQASPDTIRPYICNQG